MERVRARRRGQLLWIAIVIADIDLHRAEILREKMDALIGVLAVKMFWNGGSAEIALIENRREARGESCQVNRSEAI